MSIPDPPWKKRTRPCPFYSQGRCVFADSCGFLHDVKIKTPATRESPTSTLDAESCRNSTSSMTSIVKPPLTISVHSPASSPSPARSPRMVNLLSALRGIIGPPSPERNEFPAAAGDNASPDASDNSPHPDDTVQSAGRMLADDVPVQTVRGDVATPTCSASESASAEDPQSVANTPPGLLSPVQIGSVPPVPFPHVALGLSATLSRVDSVDSGYAETWVGPTPFSLSPPQLNQPNSTLDLLSSPFGSPLSRVLPRRFSPSPTRNQTTSPDPRDSIDLISSPVSTTASPTLPSSRMSLNGISLMYATQVLQSPHHASPFGQGGPEDASLNHGVLCESNSPLSLSSGSPTGTPFFPMLPSETPVIKDSAPMAFGENLVDVQLPCESPSSQRGEGAPSAVEGTVEAPPVSEQTSSVDSSHAANVAHSPPPPMDTEITSPLDATLPLRSPISLEPTAEVAGLDYEALFQSLVMSPEEAASKRMSWASCLSPPTLPRRAGSTGSSLAACSTSALVDVPERPHSAVGVLPWSRQCDLRVTPVLESESTSYTSSPLPGTPISSTSSQADASASSVHMSPVPRPESSRAVRSPSTYTSKGNCSPAGNQWLQSAPISAPLKEVTSTLNNHSESEPTRSKWNRVSTSRKVPFGFRQSLVADRDQLQALAPRPRKRPSALTLSSVPSIDQYETPSSALSFSSESSQSKPSWARPLHLSRPSETGLLIHRLNLHKKSLSSDVNTSTSPSCSQHHSLASSSSHSSHFPQRSHVQNSLHSEHHPSNSPTNDTLQSAPLPHTDTWRNSLQPNAKSHIYSRSPEETGTNTNTPEDEDQLRTFTRAPVPLPTMTPLQSKSSVPSPAPTSATKLEPSLMFAIASDDAKSVRRALEHGHADPNESMGPQSALAFALTNERLSHKLDIVKVLLAYGADPAALRNPELNPPHRDASAGDDAMLLSPPPTTTLEVMDPAMRYYVSRADAPQTRHVTKLLQHSLFQPLSRVRYEIVGQDHVFEQLFTVLNQHSRRQSPSPLIILLCGPSGHGKSFLARRFGSLLGVPTHTVNVTTLRSTHDLWDAYSMNLYEEMSTNTLSQFLIENEGKRCVVVLDEIEKVSEPKVLYSLLMPWELGCSPLADRRHIDVRQVIWLGTSNIGHELIFEFCGSLSGSNVTREEYLKLAQLLRPCVSQGLGASLSSRVTMLLPFTPFTEAELMAIATEAFCSLCGERASLISSDVVERVAREAIECYIPEEGARSLHRAVASLLTNIDELI